MKNLHIYIKIIVIILIITNIMLFFILKNQEIHFYEESRKKDTLLYDNKKEDIIFKHKISFDNYWLSGYSEGTQKKIVSKKNDLIKTIQNAKNKNDILYCNKLDDYIQRNVCIKNIKDMLLENMSSNMFNIIDICLYSNTIGWYEKCIMNFIDYDWNAWLYECLLWTKSHKYNCISNRLEKEKLQISFANVLNDVFQKNEKLFSINNKWKIIETKITKALLEEYNNILDVNYNYHVNIVNFEEMKEKYKLLFNDRQVIEIFNILFNIKK